jgi:hypothetical protein
VLTGVAVPHERAEQHFDQQGVTERFAQDLASGLAIGVFVEVVVVNELVDQTAIVVLLGRERARDFRFQQFGFVAEAEHHLRKTDRGANLGRQCEIVPLKRNWRSRRAAVHRLAPAWREIRDGVQADVVVPAP